MKFKIYVVGDKLERFHLEAIKEYMKRLSKYCKIQLKYLKSDELLSKELSGKSYCVLINTKGDIISSEELALKINDMGISAISDVSIVIGSKRLITRWIEKKQSLVKTELCSIGRLLELLDSREGNLREILGAGRTVPPAIG